MISEIYNLSSDFFNGLNNLQLKNEINSNPNIIPFCTNVRTNGDIVYIDFDFTINSEEKQNLNNLILSYIYVASKHVTFSDKYTLKNVLSEIKKTNKIGTFNPLTPTIIQNWIDISGSLSGWDGVSGTYTIPEDGFYSFDILFGLNTSTSTSVSFRAFNQNAETIYSEIIYINSLSTDYNGGAGSVNWINYYTIGEEIKLEVQFTLLQNATINLSIIRLFSLF